MTGRTRVTFLPSAPTYDALFAVAKLPLPLVAVDAMDLASISGGGGGGGKLSPSSDERAPRSAKAAAAFLRNV